jgi:hypothetical protein
MAKNTDPIVLTGNVYVAAYLARHYPRYQLPVELQRGDIKIDSHLDEQGKANRASKTRKGQLRGYSGFFTGLVYDGDSWRRFSIVPLVGNSARYCNQASKAEKIHSVVFRLQERTGRTAVYEHGSYLLTAGVSQRPLV